MAANKDAHNGRQANQKMKPYLVFQYLMHQSDENHVVHAHEIVSYLEEDCGINAELIHLLPHGKIADKYIRQLDDFYDHISVDQYVIMPDHIHILLSVQNGQSGTPVPTSNDRIDNKNSTLSKFVSTFKRFCNKAYGENIWQPRYYDHVVRNQQDYDEIWQYIENNPRKWIIQNMGDKL